MRYIIIKKNYWIIKVKIILYVCDYIKGLIIIVVKFYNVSFYGVFGIENINKLLRKREF